MKQFIVAAALLTLAAPSFAQEDADQYYLRNSLYMVKLDMPDKDTLYAETFNVMDSAFNNINFADRYKRYNDFNLGTRHISFSDLPETTPEEADAIDKETVAEALIREELVKDGLKNNDLREADYAAKLLKYFNNNHTANKLVMKWMTDEKNPKKWGLGNIIKYGQYGLSKEALDEAKKSENLNNSVAGMATVTKLLGNSYIVVTRYGIMTAQEAVAASTVIAEQAISRLPALAQLAANKGLELLASKIKGYFVRANGYLFQLDWDAEKTKDFMSKWGDGTIPADFIEKAPFKLKYIGRSSKRAPATMSLKASDSVNELIERATLRGTDAAFAALQRDYEDFRPMSSLHVIDGKLAAYIGTKEGIDNDDEFDVYQKKEAEDHTIEWDKIGSIKVDKKGLWDNAEGAGQKIEGAAEDKTVKTKANTALGHTIFKGKPGKFGEGCLIRLAGNKDKKKK